MENQQRCNTCERMVRASAPLWDRIYRTRLWTLVHSYNTAVLGWLVLIPNRHVETVAELTDEESAEMGRLLRLVSLALHEVTGCMKTYVAQFAEHPLHVVARYADLPLDKRGPRVFEYLGVPSEQIVSEEAMNALALQIKAFLSQKDG